MRIATRCTTVDEFIAGFHAYCDDQTLFIPTLGMRPPGLETAFSIQLADGTPMLRGLCVVLNAWETVSNPYKRPGLRVGIQRLTPESTALLEKLNAARANAKPEEKPPAVDIPPPIPAPVAETAKLPEPPRAPTPPPITEIPVVKIPKMPIGTTPPATISPAAIAEAASAHEAQQRKSDEFETPTVENKLVEPERTPGSSFILPANPLTSLSDASIGAFIDCVLFEDEFPDDPDTVVEQTGRPIEREEPRPRSASLSQMMATPVPGSRSPIPTILGVAPLSVPREEIARAHATPRTPIPTVQRPRAGTDSVEPLPAPTTGTGPIVLPPRSNIQLSIVIGVAIAAFAIALLIWIVGFRSPSTNATTEKPPERTGEVTPPPKQPPPPEVKPETKTVEPPKGSGHGSDVSAAAMPPIPDARTRAPTTSRKEDEDVPSIGTGPCRIVVTSDPAGSTVLLDGDNVGPTPIAIDGPCETRKIELSHARYDKVAKTVTPKTDAPTTVDVTLPRPKHKIKVFSTPLGATITISGRRAGTTPAIIDVMGFATLSVTAERAGYKPMTKKLYTNQPLSILNFDLKK